MSLKNLLKVGNVKELYLKDKLGLIREIVKATLIKYPFQNITSFGAFLPRDRLTPTFRHLLLSGIRGEGGLCGHLNGFLKYQLESLEYDVELMGGCFRRTGVPHSHFLAKVTLPSRSDGRHNHSPPPAGSQVKQKSYLVDVGCGIPLHEPICIEELPYRGRAGGLDFRYERVDDRTLQRVNENGDAIMGKKPSTYLSPQDYTIDVKPRHFTELHQQARIVYNNPRSVFLHQGVYCHRYLDITDDDFEIVCVRGTELMFITKDTRHAQLFPSYADIQPSLLKYFPMIEPEEINLAVKHFSIPFEEAIKMTARAVQ